MGKTNYEYVGCCVDLKGSDIQAMVDLAKEVEVKTMKNVCDGFYWLEKQLGYHAKFPITGDYHVKAYRSKYRGKKCYFLCHSAIEYVFVYNDL